LPRDMVPLLLLLLLILGGASPSYASARGQACLGPGSAPSDNYCVGEYDEDGGFATPNCVNVGSRSSPDWRCARCAANCDCPPGYYCVKTPGPSAGECAALAQTGKIGGPCAILAGAPEKGLDDAALCGAAIFDDDDGAGEFVQFEWLGSCVGGKCSACAGGKEAWALAVAAQLVPGLLQDAGEWSCANWTGDGGRACDCGSLICDGRMCDRGAVVYKSPWFVDMIPMGVNVAILVFVALIFGLGLVVVCMQCCREGKALDRIVDALAPQGKRKRGHVQLNDKNDEDDEEAAADAGGKRDKDGQ